jgi:ribosomal protein S18 acetylase RimI-like enzyme
MTGTATIRPATRDDARAIAALFQISSDGVADYVWSLLRDEYPGLSLIEIGERRYAREDTDFSYENCIVAEDAGRVVGMLHSFAMPDTLEPPPDDMDPVLRPYAELEIAASLYISGLALEPDYRGRGLGTRFLEIACERARDVGLKQLSLIVFEANEGALRLYKREGFTERDRRKIVPHPMIHYTGDAILMARVLD